MTKTKRNLIITFSVIIAVVALIVIFSALFSVKKINVEVLSNSERLSSYSSEAIIKKSKISKGKSIIFLNTQRSLENLEKEFPHARFQIVRTFPSTATIYLYEREPVFKIKNSQAYYEVYDENLKCLDIVAESSLKELGLDNIPTLHGSSMQLCGEEGKFATDSLLKNKIGAIVDGIYGAEQSSVGIMSDIIIGYDEQISLHTITLKICSKQEGKDNGGTIVVEGESYLKEKIAFSLYTYINICDTNEYRNILDQLKITAPKDFDPNDDINAVGTKRRVIVYPKMN